MARHQKQLRSLRDSFKRTLFTSVRIAKDLGMTTLLTQSIEKIGKKEFSSVPPLISDFEYAAWILRNEPQEKELKQQHEQAKAYSYKPLLSIAMPVWNPQPTLLTETIASVISQTYENWELCIADGNSNITIMEVINSFANQDSRIKVKRLPANFGISNNTNTAIQNSNGEYLALLDHDDLLSPNAFFEMVNCLNSNPKLDFIYSDMDRMTIDGKRIDPFFKPNWSPETMLSANFVTQLCLIRSSLLKDVAGFNPETDGAQDWDLFLRVSEKTEKIQHIPKILYHWRQSLSSVSYGGIRVKPYAKRAQLLTLEQFLSRNNMPAMVSHEPSGYLRVTWEIDLSNLISIIVFDSGSIENLATCLRSILNNSSRINIEIIVVHNRNRPNDPYLNNKIKFVKSSDQLSYSKAYNLGARHAKGEVFVLLESRTEVKSINWLQELTGWCTKPRIAIAGPKILFSNGQIYHGGVIVGLSNYLFEGARQRSRTLFGDTEWYRNCAAISWHCLALERKLFEEIGNFNENITDSDIEFCSRARDSAYRIVYTPHAKLQLQSSSTIEERPPCSVHDPYINPNLSYNHPIPTLV